MNCKRIVSVYSKVNPICRNTNKKARQTNCLAFFTQLLTVGTLPTIQEPYNTQHKAYTYQKCQ